MTMKADINYQELSTELDTILAQLQTNDFDVDEALKLYERGVTISKQLESYLKDAENTVTKLKASFNK